MESILALEGSERRRKALPAAWPPSRHATAGSPCRSHEAARGPVGPRPEGALDEIFQQVSEHPVDASRKTLAYLRTEGNRADDFMAAARRMSSLECRNGHDYKFPSAVLEGYRRISPRWRDLYLAASVHYLRGHGDRDNALVPRTRAALAG